MRLPIISDTTRSVRVISGVEAYGKEQDGCWFIGIDCPVDGRSISPVGPFYAWADAMNAIKQGEY